MRYSLRGRAGITLRTLRKVARELDWPLAYLVTRIELSEQIDKERRVERGKQGRLTWCRRIGERDEGGDGELVMSLGYTGI
jgi:hypothetical protein